MRRPLTPLKKLAQVAPLSTDTTAIRKQRQLYLDDADCTISPEEACKAQRTLGQALFNMCTIEHTNDVLPADRLLSVLCGKESLREALRAVGLYQQVILPTEDAEPSPSVNAVGLYLTDFNGTIAGTKGERLVRKRQSCNRFPC